MDLIRPAASPLEAASRLISGKLSADDPFRPMTNIYAKCTWELEYMQSRDLHEPGSVSCDRVESRRAAF